MQKFVCNNVSVSSSPRLRHETEARVPSSEPFPPCSASSLSFTDDGKRGGERKKGEKGAGRRKGEREANESFGFSFSPFLSLSQIHTRNSQSFPSFLSSLLGTSCSQPHSLPLSFPPLLMMPTEEWALEAHKTAPTQPWKGSFLASSFFLSLPNLRLC